MSLESSLVIRAFHRASPTDTVKFMAEVVPAAMRGKGDEEDKEHKYLKGKSTSTAGIALQGGAKRTNKDVKCGECSQLGHNRTKSPYDDTDDVITHDGKKERKPGNKKSVLPSKRNKSNNFGVSLADVDSWMPAIARGNKRRINS
eukprot:CAMPEP_0178494648 /NCGR_PEP_ID=MMETSP0696-20121128/13125_1 /TAXON_ID=265572 /ORGANISM="Extubocellulus spinifer, Strain CCMP396" /LENGTH=144 /DNA_ID=CAMNT_0020122737 /DNA_START=316 /DNA_END=752 /DNA_ORIENTATION=+